MSARKSPPVRPFAARLWSRRSDLPLVVEALLAVTLASLAIKLLSFDQLLTLAGRPVRGAMPDAARRAATGARIGWAVPGVARRLPWRARCFPQGLAAQWMLRRRGIGSTFYYGASIMDQGLEAHVWVCDGDRAVVGGKEALLMRTLVRVPAADEAGPLEPAT